MSLMSVRGSSSLSAVCPLRFTPLGPYQKELASTGKASVRIAGLSVDPKTRGWTWWQGWTPLNNFSSAAKLLTSSGCFPSWERLQGLHSGLSLADWFYSTPSIGQPCEATRFGKPNILWCLSSLWEKGRSIFRLVASRPTPCNLGHQNLSQHL